MGLKIVSKPVGLHGGGNSNFDDISTAVIKSFLNLGFGICYMLNVCGVGLLSQLDSRDLHYPLFFTYPI